MNRQLIVHSVGPSVSLQDLGRPGHLAQGLSRGGAADVLALVEGAALLNQSMALAALEMAGSGGKFEVSAPTRIALTGAPMVAELDGSTLAWNASHLVLPGQILTLGRVLVGSYGYLHVGGGFDAPQVLGARSAHLKGGLGAPVASGSRLSVGQEAAGLQTGLLLPLEDRFTGGTVSVLPTAQTALFDASERARFEATPFKRDPRGNRQGVLLNFDAPPFRARNQLNVLSEIIVPGDIQITGDGTPFVLLPECQTTGGYPRIATVVPDDLPRVAQAAAGAPLQFQFITRDAALARHRAETARQATLARTLTPLVRDPHDMPDLLSYQLISGVTAGHD